MHIDAFILCILKKSLTKTFVHVIVDERCNSLFFYAQIWDARVKKWR